MGYERHGADLASAKLHPTLKAGSAAPSTRTKPEKAPARQAEVVEPLDIQREARRMRQEWREQRYARLRAH